MRPRRGARDGVQPIGPRRGAGLSASYASRDVDGAGGAAETARPYGASGVSFPVNQPLRTL